MRTRTIGSLLMSLALLLGVITANAKADTLRLKDGRVLEGTVARESSGLVWFKYKVGGVETTGTFAQADILRLEKDSGTPTPAPKVDPVPENKPAEVKPAETPAIAPAEAPKTAANPANAPARSSAPRAAVITLGEGGEKDMVGLFITARALEEAIPLLEKEKIDTVVFRVNSGGGALSEIQKLSDVIELQYKKKFKVVAWIESAISAAAMTSHCIEEIYLMKRGNYGACTGWRGALEAVKGRQLEEVLYMMEKISARGKHDPLIMRSMQIMEPLSCSIDENGDVHWYKNLDGEFIVNPAERILTFNSETARKYKFSSGTADTIEELGKAMGLTEVVWVGKNIPGTPYPVCAAEELQRSFREKTAKDQEAFQGYWDKYQSNVAAARSVPVEERGKFVALARTALENIKRMLKNNPNFALMTFGMTPEQIKDWLEERDEELRKLLKK